MRPMSGVIIIIMTGQYLMYNLDPNPDTITPAATGVPVTVSTCKSICHFPSLSCPVIRSDKGMETR